MHGRVSEKAVLELRLKQDKCWGRVFAEGRRVIRGGAWQDQGQPEGVHAEKRYPGMGGDTEDGVAIRQRS